jgi:hypothetical protein
MPVLHVAPTHLTFAGRTPRARLRLPQVSLPPRRSGGNDFANSAAALRPASRRRNAGCISSCTPTVGAYG